MNNKIVSLYALFIQIVRETVRALFPFEYNLNEQKQPNVVNMYQPKI